MVVGQRNVINEALVSRDKIILPPLHIKLGLMKQFVKALDKDGPCFVYIGRKMPGISAEKLKAGIFDGPQIRQLVKDPEFVNSMSPVESRAWKSFVQVITKFWETLKLTIMLSLSTTCSITSKGWDAT